MIMHEHMGYFYFEPSFCLSFFTCLYPGTEPRFKVNEKHPSFQSILHPSCYFTSLGSEACVPFSHSRRASGEFEYTFSAYLYKIPKAAREYGREGKKHRSCCVLHLKNTQSDTNQQVGMENISVQRRIISFCIQMTANVTLCW